MWKELERAFAESDGFTVHFILTSGKELEISMTPIKPQDTAIRGELITHDRAPVTIAMSAVAAYWIEES